MTFNQSIRELQRLINNGQYKSAEYYRILDIAVKINPNRRTPVGFYLDGPRPYTQPNGQPVRD